ncbi:MAG: hypothetical protein HYS98_02905 [Deltaproteobacteria bacterium]|nr:hypothetical protein [Deltaproteobacteria bacterium]
MQNTSKLLFLYAFSLIVSAAYSAIAQEPIQVQRLKQMIDILKTHPEYALVKTNKLEYEKQKEHPTNELRKYFDFNTMTEQALHERYKNEYWTSGSSKKEFQKTLQELIEAIAYPQVQKSLKKTNFLIQYSDHVDREESSIKVTMTTIFKAESKEEVDIKYKIVFYFNKKGLIYDLISYDEDNEPYFHFVRSLREQISEFIKEKKNEKSDDAYNATVLRLKETLAKVRDGKYLFAD